MAGLTPLSNHSARCCPPMYFMALITCVVIVVLVMIVTDPSDHYSVRYPTPVKQNSSVNSMLNRSGINMRNASMAHTFLPKRTGNPLLQRDRLSGSTPILSLNYAHMNYNLEKKKLLVVLWSSKLRSVFQFLEQPEVCEYTYNHTMVEQADFVFFHSRSLGNLAKLPNRTQSQRWVIHTKESAQSGSSSNRFLASLANLFNFSSHYSIGADIHFPYGWCEDSSANDESRWPSFPNKTGSVLWIVSNCHPKSNREKYVHKLKQYIKVDTYGNCGGKALLRNNNDLRVRLYQKYKFYLAFENSFCTEYVTEKLYQVISDDSLYVIPIVLGLDDYDMLPKDAIIDVRDFSSPELLAEHLDHLSNDNEAFMKYFEWRNKRKCFLNVNDNMGGVTLCDSLWKLYNKPTPNGTSVLSKNKLDETFGIQNCVAANEFYKGLL